MRGASHSRLPLSPSVQTSTVPYALQRSCGAPRLSPPEAPGKGTREPELSRAAPRHRHRDRRATISGAVLERRYQFLFAHRRTTADVFPSSFLEQFFLGLCFQFSLL